MTTRLKELYVKKIAPQLQKDFGLANIMAVPRITKVVLNVGMGRILKEPNAQQTVINTLTRISGQKPVLTKARKSIASFKIREGMVIGAKVTLRGTRMEEFVDKLVNITLPRVRDFRGLPESSVAGNMLTIGIKEHIVFPEIPSEDIARVHGLEVTVVSTATQRAHAVALFRALGFPLTTDAVTSTPSLAIKPSAAPAKAKVKA